MTEGIDVAVVGAGIVGLAVGLTLQMEGRRVTLFDPEEPASGCSSGNAGYIADNEIVPLPQLSVLPRLPHMLLDPLGPMVIRPAYLGRLAPWALRALRATAPDRSGAVTDALAALNTRAIGAYGPLLERAGAAHLVDRRGALHVCRTRAGLARQARQLAVVRAHGVDGEVIGADRLRQMEPALGPDLLGAVFYPTAARCTQPAELGKRFAAAIVAGGGTFRREPVTALRPSDGAWRVRTPAGETVAREVVVCAGAWSRALVEPLGLRAPLDTERGYHLMLPDPGLSLSRPVVFVERAFAATPMDHGLRLAGTVEFAGIEAPMDPRRADILYDLARAFLPGLRREGAVRWMGRRPTLPDWLPAIGRADRIAGLTYAFGHQHLGLTQAAITGQCVAALIADRPPPINMAPYALSRFGPRRNPAI